MKLTLKITRQTRQAREQEAVVEAYALEAVTRALEDALENGVNLNLPSEPMTPDEVRHLSKQVALRAWSANKLTSESPQSLLHTERAEWGPPAVDAPGVPRELVAADVLDFLAGLLGDNDQLSCSVQEEC